jgi:hypothetical protein
MIILERSLHPAAALGHVTYRGDVLDKFILNGGEILKNDLPRLGGNWVPRLLSVRSPPAISESGPATFPVLSALGRWPSWPWCRRACQTHLSADSPEINSENLLVLLSPLVLVFGAGVFFTLDGS